MQEVHSLRRDMKTTARLIKRQIRNLRVFLFLMKYPFFMLYIILCLSLIYIELIQLTYKLILSEINTGDKPRIYIFITSVNLSSYRLI